MPYENYMYIVLLVWFIETAWAAYAEIQKYATTTLVQPQGAHNLAE